MKHILNKSLFKKIKLLEHFVFAIIQSGLCPCKQEIWQCM